jgi:hypothetical protein
MRTDPRVVAELQSMFREGNTPSSLIKHIVARHQDEPNVFPLIQSYFRAAFAVPLVRVSNRPEDYCHSDLRLAHLNIHLLHEMIQHRAEWDQERWPTTGDGLSWLDSVVATDELELIERAQPASLPEFSTCWKALDEGAQNYIKRLMGNVNALHERVRASASLTERLQQRIAELQEQLTRRKG